MKYNRFIILTLFILQLIFVYALAENNSTEAKLQTTCPVMRGHSLLCYVDRDVYADYKGKRVYFCSQECIQEFKKDPEKYIKILEDEGVTLEKVPRAEKKD